MTRQKEVAQKMNVIIDTMNTLRFLGCVEDSHNKEHIWPDCRLNEILIYYNDYLFEVCEALDRMPSIEPCEDDSTSCRYKLSAFYRGIEIMGYFHSEKEKEIFEQKMAEYQQKLWDEMAEDKKDDEDEE